MPTATYRIKAATGPVLLGALFAALLLVCGLTLGLQGLIIAIAPPTLLAAAYLVWQVDPAYTFCAAMFLTPFAGNWHQMHVPTGIDPDRILLSVAIVQVMLRSSVIRHRPRLRIGPPHVFMLLALLFVVVSAFIAKTLFVKDPLFKIIDAFGILPFLTFFTVPLAFRTPRHRSILLATLVAMGLYLGLTVVFETAHLDALVYPKYILNAHVGIQYGRGRGPFADAVANGFALYVCAVAGLTAVRVWRRPRARALAASVGLLCFLGAYLSLQRSVWVGATLGTIVMMLVTPYLRKLLLPMIAIGVIGLFAALVVIPGLRTSATKRANQVGTLYDRQNLTVAGINMLQAKPVTGFGWLKFQSDSQLYFRQSQNYPLTATKLGIHNFILGYAVDLGIPGLLLWVLALITGVGGALLTRGPPDQQAWRSGMIAIAIIFLVVANSVPPTLFPNEALWLWAGVVFSGRYAGRLIVPAGGTRGAPGPDGEDDAVPMLPARPAVT